MGLSVDTALTTRSNWYMTHKAYLLTVCSKKFFKKRHNSCKSKQQYALYNLDDEYVTDWFLSNKKQNQLAHAKTGNSSTSRNKKGGKKHKYERKQWQSTDPFADDNPNPAFLIEILDSYNVNSRIDALDYKSRTLINMFNHITTFSHPDDVMEGLKQMERVDNYFMDNRRNSKKCADNRKIDEIIRFFERSNLSVQSSIIEVVRYNYHNIGSIKWILENFFGDEEMRNLFESGLGKDETSSNASSSSHSDSDDSTSSQTSESTGSESHEKPNYEPKHSSGHSGGGGNTSYGNTGSGPKTPDPKPFKGKEPPNKGSATSSSTANQQFGGGTDTGTNNRDCFNNFSDKPGVYGQPFKNLGFFTSLGGWLDTIFKNDSDLILKEDDRIIVSDGNNPSSISAPDISKVDVVLEDYPIYYLHGESFLTFLSFTTPHFDSKGYDWCSFIYKSKKQVKLPTAVLLEMSQFWVGRTRDSENFLLSQKHFANLLAFTTIPLVHKDNAIAYGPLVCYAHRYFEVVKTDENNRVHRQYMKTKQNVRRANVLLIAAAVSVLVVKLTKFTIKGVGIIKRISNLFPFADSWGSLWSDLKNEWSGSFLDNIITAKKREIVGVKNAANEIQQMVVVKDGGFWKPTFFTWAVIIAPIWEEFVRTISPKFFTAFAVSVEPLGGNTLLHLLNYSLTQRHGCWRSLPERICYHSLFNLSAYSIQMVMQQAGHTGAVPQPASVISALKTKFNNWMFPKVIKSKEFLFKGYRRYDPTPCAMNKFPPMDKDSALSGFLPKKQIKENKTFQYLFGIGDEAYKPIFYSSNRDNESKSLRDRTLKETIRPDPIVLKDFIKFFKNNIKYLLPKTYKYGVHEKSFDEYLKNSNARPSVKKILQKTFEELTKMQLNSHSGLSQYQRRKWSKRKAFVKVENLNYMSDHDLLIKSPRMIQGAAAEFICLIGPWMASFQDKVKRDLNANNFVCFTSGVDTFKAAQNLVSLGGTMVEDDVSSWDISMCREIMELECWMFEYFKCPLAVSMLCRANIDTKGVTSNGFFFFAKGRRKSGDPYTSLGNSIFNAMFHLYIVWKEKGTSMSQMRCLLRMLVQGDDNAMSLPSSWKKIDFKKWMYLLGFKAKAVYRVRWIDVEFCSMRLYPVLEGWTFAPKVGKVLSKFGFFVDPPFINPKQLVRGTVLGLINGVSFIEPFNIVMTHLMKLTDGVKAIPFTREEWQMRFSKCTATADTFYALSQIYSWDSGMKEIFTKEISKTKLGSSTVGPVFRWLCDTDTAGRQKCCH